VVHAEPNLVCRTVHSADAVPGRKTGRPGSHTAGPNDTERSTRAVTLITRMTAERERALADNAPTARASWRAAANGLIDAIVARWQAPVTREG